MMERHFAGMARDVHTVKNIAVAWMVLSLIGAALLILASLLSSVPRQMSIAVEPDATYVDTRPESQKKQDMDRQRKEIEDLIRRRTGK
jgi:hypothetical protein